MIKVILAAICSVVTSTALACDMPSGWLEMRINESSQTRIAVSLPSQPIKISEPFDVDLYVCEGNEQSYEIELDATMPAHKHGMNYRADVSMLEPTKYRGTGMFFHMPGQWQITVDLIGEDRHHFYLDVTAQ